MQMLSIYSSLSWLMAQVYEPNSKDPKTLNPSNNLTKPSLTYSHHSLEPQALITRIMVPGISNFVNASVTSLRPRECGSSACATLFHD